LSEAAAAHLLGALVSTPGLDRPPRPPRASRKVRRLRDQLATQEQELLRRQNTLLALTRQASSLRQELAAMVRERDELQRHLDHVRALRTSEAAQARRLADAVLDQQAAVRELERATAGLSALR
jgi:predicted RNase H-like nuclease (RuvC/YqgF family)